MLTVCFLVCLIVPEVEGSSRALQAAAFLTFQFVGGLISLIAAGEVLMRASRGEPVLSLLNWTIALLAGAVIISMHWGVAISLAAVVTASIIQKVLPTQPATVDEQRSITSPPENRSAN